MSTRARALSPFWCPPPWEVLQRLADHGGGLLADQDAWEQGLREEPPIDWRDARLGSDLLALGLVAWRDQTVRLTDDGRALLAWVRAERRAQQEAESEPAEVIGRTRPNLPELPSDDDTAWKVGARVSVARDDGRVELREVTEAAWEETDGRRLVGLSGIRGGYPLARVREPAFRWPAPPDDEEAEVRLCDALALIGQLGAANEALSLALSLGDPSKAVEPGRGACAAIRGAIKAGLLTADIGHLAELFRDDLNTAAELQAHDEVPRGLIEDLEDRSVLLRLLMEVGEIGDPLLQADTARLHPESLRELIRSLRWMEETAIEPPALDAAPLAWSLYRERARRQDLWRDTLRAVLWLVAAEAAAGKLPALGEDDVVAAFRAVWGSR